MSFSHRQWKIYESCIALLSLSYVSCSKIFRHDNKSSVWQLTTPPNDYMHNQIVIIIHIYRLANTRTFLSVDRFERCVKIKYIKADRAGAMKSASRVWSQLQWSSVLFLYDLLLLLFWVFMMCYFFWNFNSIPDSKKISNKNKRNSKWMRLLIICTLCRVHAAAWLMMTATC